MKNKIVVVLVAALALSFVACAGTSEGANGGATAKTDSPAAQEKDAQYQQGLDNKQAMLESMFRGFLDAVRNGAPADTLYAYLTDSSEYWLDTLENHAKVYDSEALDTCQFYEAYTIILYRLYEREHLWETDEDRRTITVTMPSSEIQAVTIDKDTFKIYSEKDSLWNPLKLEDYNISLDEFETAAKEKALASGILTRSDEQAQNIVRRFIQSLPGMSGYTVEFQ